MHGVERPGPPSVKQSMLPIQKEVSKDKDERNLPPEWELRDRPKAAEELLRCHPVRKDYRPEHEVNHERGQPLRDERLKSIPDDIRAKARA